MKNYIKYLYIVLGMCFSLSLHNVFAYSYKNNIDKNTYCVSKIAKEHNSNEKTNVKLLNKSNSGNNEEAHFSFIKSNNTFGGFGDTTLLLYLGISLISVSIIGILFTLIPRKNKKAKIKKNTKYKNRK